MISLYTAEKTWKADLCFVCISCVSVVLYEKTNVVGNIYKIEKSKVCLRFLINSLLEKVPLIEGRLEKCNLKHFHYLSYVQLTTLHLLFDATK